jgi:hypothetical protein
MIYCENVFYMNKKKLYKRTGPDRSSDSGPKTVKTGPRTDTGPVFARTDPTLPFFFLTNLPYVNSKLNAS